jgi:hypothetical protein
MPDANLVVDLVADVDDVVLAISTDSPSAQKPAPTRDAVAPERPPEDESAPVELEVDARLLANSVEINIELVAGVARQLDQGARHERADSAGARTMVVSSNLVPATRMLRILAIGKHLRYREK